MTYTKSTSDPPEDLEYIRDGVEDVGEFGRERTGVTHLVHAWYQQGHSVFFLFFSFFWQNKHLSI